MAPQSIPRLELVYRPRTPWMKGRSRPLEEGPWHTIQKLIFLPVFPQRNLEPFTSITVLWGKVNNQMFWGLLDNSSELILISGEENVTVAPQSEEGLMEVR